MVKKKTVLFDVGIAVLFLAVAAFAYFIRGEAVGGAFAVVTVDGELFGRYSLSADREISINGHNTLTIKDGGAIISYSDCPSHECEKAGTVKNAGEIIVCLPNKVMVRIEAAGDIDAVVK